MKKYILDENHNVVRCDDVLTWARWFEQIDNRTVDQTRVSGDCFVSTVFLGLDHRFIGNGPPLVFETMVFGGPVDFDESQRRYSSWDDAEIGHKMIVDRVLFAMKAKARFP